MTHPRPYVIWMACLAAVIALVGLLGQHGYLGDAPDKARVGVARLFHRLINL